MTCPYCKLDAIQRIVVNGFIYYKCTGCNHTFENPFFQHPLTCTRCGIIIGYVKENDIQFLDTDIVCKECKENTKTEITDYFGDVCANTDCICDRSNY